ncbi:MAG TPA: hypothetical protein P5096_00905 [Patescibacteria group bacterium]|nr:hypothetical protein [Patescibacteria group bacterium]
MTVGLPEDEKMENFVEKAVEVNSAIVSALKTGVSSLYGDKPAKKDWRKDLRRECKVLDPSGELFRTLSKAVGMGTVSFPEVSHKVQ